MGTTEKHSSVLTGVSGEYFVPAELSKLGYIASITKKILEVLTYFVRMQVPQEP
jgi:hypothetical protein